MADTEVQDGQLRRFVVRIDEPGNNVTRGSGVLVAPGWVLSCAHVVEGLDRVSVVPDRGAAAEGDAPLAVTGWVRARSDTRPDVSATAFWPFPDLAAIELEDWSDHLFAPLVLAEPLRTGESHAWGFGRREAGVAAVGSPASFVYVGLEGDGFLSLKAGDAPPGLSGAPLVCPARRGVVGVMSVSRNPSDARGGWASPAAALAGDQGARGELAGLGARIVARNQGEAWRHRDTWSRVLPVTGADRTVNMPWEGLGARLPAPSMMLHAEFCLVHYLFRDADLNAGVSWCRSQSPVEISYIDAQGGAGKTRFAIELCQQMRRRGWVAGMLPRQDHGISEIQQPRLVAVDYVEERDSAALAEQISALVRSATAMTPVRVLLLSRPTRGQRPGARLDILREQEAASDPAIEALDDAEDRSAAVPSLTVPERGILFDSALLAFGRRWHGAEWTPQISGQVDLSADRYDKPLDVLLEAFDAALSGPEWHSGAALQSSGHSTTRKNTGGRHASWELTLWYSAVAPRSPPSPVPGMSRKPQLCSASSRSWPVSRPLRLADAWIGGWETSTTALTGGIPCGPTGSPKHSSLGQCSRKTMADGACSPRCSRCDPTGKSSGHWTCSLGSPRTWPLLSLPR